MCRQNTEDSSMHGEIDRIGLKMLRLLQGNGRLTNAELAQLVDVSPATCHRRTQALFKEGYISRVRAMIAPQQVDRVALVMVGVVLHRSTVLVVRSGLRRCRGRITNGGRLWPGSRQAQSPRSTQRSAPAGPLMRASHCPPFSASTLRAWSKRSVRA